MHLVAPFFLLIARLELSLSLSSSGQLNSSRLQTAIARVEAMIQALPGPAARNALKPNIPVDQLKTQVDTTLGEFTKPLDNVATSIPIKVKNLRAANVTLHCSTIHCFLLQWARTTMIRDSSAGFASRESVRDSSAGFASRESVRGRKRGGRRRRSRRKFMAVRTFVQLV